MVILLVVLRQKSVKPLGGRTCISSNQYHSWPSLRQHTDLRQYSTTTRFLANLVCISLITFRNRYIGVTSPVSLYIHSVHTLSEETMSSSTDFILRIGGASGNSAKSFAAGLHR